MLISDQPDLFIDMEHLLKNGKGPTTLKVVNDSWHLPVIKNKLPSEKLSDFLKYQKGSYSRYFSQISCVIILFCTLVLYMIYRFSEQSTKLW